MSSACSWQQGQGGNLWAKNMPSNSLVPKHLQKIKNSIIRNLCTTSALLYLSPMTHSIHVKSSSFSKSTNFSGNQPSEFCLREKEMSDSGNSGRCVHWRGLCSLQTVELHPSANCLFFMLYITGAHKQAQPKHLENPKDSSVSYQHVQKTMSWADYQ